MSTKPGSGRAIGPDPPSNTPAPSAPTPNQQTPTSVVTTSIGIPRKPIDLMANLYHKPGASDVLRKAQGPNRLNGSERPLKGFSGPPHPPETSVPQSLHTVMYRRDYSALQRARLAGKGQRQQSDKLTVDMLYKAAPVDTESIKPVKMEEANMAATDPWTETECASSADLSSSKSSSMTDVSQMAEGADQGPLLADPNGDDGRPTYAGSRAGSTGPLPNEITQSRMEELVAAGEPTYSGSIVDLIVQLRTSLGWNSSAFPTTCEGSREVLLQIKRKAHDPSVIRCPQEDSGKFYYCLPKGHDDPREPYLPYDLVVVPVKVARQVGIYWTVSASTVTLLDSKDPIISSKITPVLQWIWEKEIYTQICKIPVIAKFRLWKTFMLWKDVVQSSRSGQSRDILRKQLFTANEVLQGCMLHVQSLCESASGSLTGRGKPESAILFVNLDKSSCLTLEEFMAVQNEQADKSIHMLKELQKEVVLIVWECCASVAEQEGVTQGIRPDTRGKGRPTYTQVSQWRKVLSRLAQFLKVVDYQILELLRRLVKTSLRSLIEFFNQSSTIVGEEVDPDDGDASQSDDSDSEHNVGRHFRSETPQIVREIPKYKVSKTEQISVGFPNPYAKKPADAYLPPEFDMDAVSSVHGPLSAEDVLEEIRTQGIIEEIPEPVFHFDLSLSVGTERKKGEPGKRDSNRSALHKSAHDPDARKNVSFGFGDPYAEESASNSSDSEASNEDGGSDSTSSEESSEPLSKGSAGRRMHTSPRRGHGFAYSDRRSVSKKSSRQHDQNRTKVQICPSMNEFKTSMKSLVGGFNVTIESFVPMSEEPRLAVFCSPPEYDLHLHYDEANHEEEEEIRSAWPDSSTVLGSDVEYLEMVTKLQDVIDQSTSYLEEFTESYEKYCLMVDHARTLDMSSISDRMTWSTDEFHQSLSSHTSQVSKIKKMITSRRIGMLELSAEKFRDDSLPYPQTILKAINKHLPVIAYKRNEDLLNIIKNASKRLDREPTTVDEFVDHLGYLGRMTQEMSALEREFGYVTKMYTIAKEFDVDIHPEEFALYQTLTPSFQHIKNTILFCEAKKEENIHLFSADLNKLIRETRFSLMTTRNYIRDQALVSAETLPLIALERIKLLQDDVQGLTVKVRSYANYQERFGSSLGSKQEYSVFDREETIKAQVVQSELNEIERDLTLRRLLWESQEELAKLIEEWKSTPFELLNVEALQKNVSRFTQTVYMLEKGLPQNDVVPKVKQRVTDFKQGMPVITSLRNPTLRTRHWKEIENLIGRQIPRGKEFTLGNLLDMNIFKQKEKIQDISTTASNEATLEGMLQKVSTLWQSTDFRFVVHQGRDTHIITGADDIMSLLEESQITVATIKGSRYVTPIKHQVEDWDRRLALFLRTLDEWMTCQRKWLYLEQIFGNQDIQRQLPGEAKVFTAVDRSWKDIMRRTVDRPNAMKATTGSGVLEMLQSANSNLEKIRKTLEEYLESKRLLFPRFYFLSNEELLDILAQSKNPEAVQPHLDKCFGNIRSLEILILPRQPPTVHTMKSAEGEVVIMGKNVRARGLVEQWLGSVETGMFDTVKKHLKDGMMDMGGSSLKEWVIKHPGQVTLTAFQIAFSKDVVKAFTATSHIVAALKGVKERLMTTLADLTQLVSTDLVHYKRLSAEALLIIQVHNRDILTSLIEDKVVSQTDFEWLRQLRYKWDDQKNTCVIMQSDGAFDYGYEYLGCSPRLVMTPLTDRCYLTLTGALYLHLGGSPAGPAGTGKTETVKDLAKTMGKQCVVFNCSEGLDYKMLGKFFSGLAQSGSWCCFDEFNRIDVEVLSVVAQQIHTIKTAKMAGAKRFVFEGREIRLNMTCGYYITMNPTYAGRVELPDNLKSLFRPVAMMVPDYPLIAEIMLFSEGFTSAKNLSRKIVNLYQLASTQLSQQDHYDFGMRAIKSILVMAGTRKRQYQQGLSTGGKKTLTEEEEAFILIHSLKDVNLPKFLAEDVPLFQSLLEDLFPGVLAPQPDKTALEKAITMAVRDQGIHPWANQLEKVKQLHSQLLVRHGIMLVGPTGGGKTTVRNILQRALVLLPGLEDYEGDLTALDVASNKAVMQLLRGRKKGHVEAVTVNPKCVKLGDLYGEADPNTFEWSDGLIANTIRNFVKDTVTKETEERAANAGTQSAPTSASHPPKSAVSTTRAGEGEARDSEHITDWQWLILDGPVDTIWVENLNTVLDDTKVLCLSNGERIGLSQGVRLIFEVDNLSQASPATISRCAMVYMDPVDLGWAPYVHTWLRRLPKEFPAYGREHLWALFEHSLDKGLKFWRENIRYQHVPAPEMSLVLCLCGFLSAFIDFMNKNCGFGGLDSHSPDMKSNMASNLTLSGSQGSWEDKSTAKKQRKKTSSAGGDKYNESAKDYYIQKNPSQLRAILGKVFVFAFTWSVGGNFRRDENLDDDGGIIQRGDAVKEETITYDFDSFVHDLFDTEPPLGIRLPTGNKTIYSYFIDFKSGNFVPWEVLVPTTTSLIEKSAMLSLGEHLNYGSTQKQGETIVPTVDTVRYSFLTSLLVLDKHPVLLTGDSGIGKSALIHHVLKELSKKGGTGLKSDTLLGSVFNYADRNSELIENIMTLTSEEPSTDRNYNMYGEQTRVKLAQGILSSVVQFSAQTSVERTCSQIIQRLVKKGRDTLVGPKGRRVVVFIDDLNMPAPEKYGAQPPLELLRQFLDTGGFFELKKSTVTWKSVSDVSFISACAPPSGGRHPLNPRLLKHFCMLALPVPSSRSLQHIYQVQLGKFFHEEDFAPDVKDSLFPLVSGSIALYYRMCQGMLPTPMKIHYTFNIRDLTQVIHGLFQASEEVIVNKEQCARILSHETTRVFHDRLTCEEDRRIFYGYLSDMLHDYFKVRWDAESLYSNPVLFGDFLDVDATGGTGPAASVSDQSVGTGAVGKIAQSSKMKKIYRPTQDVEKLARILDEYHMRQHLGNVQAKKYVFFEEAVHHITRALRVFRQPSRHMMLVGVDGTGKSTTVGLSCYVAGCELYRLTLTRGYGVPDFREDLKKVFSLAGVKGRNVVFLLTDSDIVKEVFLEDINCILNSGEVPGLFDEEEMDGIIMELKQEAFDNGVPDTRLSVYEFFIRRVKKNLHIVLTMSPAGGTFRQRCRMNPSLINCCTIDWYDDWSQEAMLAVANVFLPTNSFDIDSTKSPEALREIISEICVLIHKGVEDEVTRYWDEVRRRHYITPSSYLEFIKIYSKALQRNKKEFFDSRERLLIGLSKLSEANSLVGIMQDELAGLGPKIEEKAKDTEMLLEQLSQDQEAVDQVRAIVEQERQVMEQETQIVQDYANECERDLAEVIPALESATLALDALNRNDITEVKAYLAPPQLVITLMDAVQTLLLVQEPNWASAKMLLGQTNFLERLIEIDKDHLPEKIFKRLKKYTGREGFTVERSGQVSQACKSICMWVLALQHYHEVFRMVKPKQKRLDGAREALKLAQANLGRKESSLAKIVNHLTIIQSQYQESVNQRESLKEKKVTTALRLQRASVLTTALADEKVRWADSVSDLDRRIDGIMGDTLLSSAAVAYVGVFTARYRSNLLTSWRQLCAERGVSVRASYELVKSMVPASEVLQWHTKGLPQDTNSTENAVFIKHSPKWPLLIDPQNQAFHWIKETEGKRLIVVDADDPNYLKSVERAIRVGDPIMLQKVSEELDPSLVPVLTKVTFTRSGTEIMRIGDTEIEYNDNFRLYMQTTMSNPHFLPSVCINVNVLNFTVTFDGLQEQLLSTVVRQENEELELQRTELLQSIAQDMAMLKELEDRSLNLLQSTQGHILDDQDLVETLQKSKVMSGEIGQRYNESEETEKRLSQARQKYLPVATRGAILYFVLTDLSHINSMYQFSLPWFKSMFADCIDLRSKVTATSSSTSVLAGVGSTRASFAGVMRPGVRGSVGGERAARGSGTGEALLPSKERSGEDLKAYMKLMIDRLTKEIYRIVSMGLFSQHQIVFSFLLCSNIMKSRGVLLPKESISTDTDSNKDSTPSSPKPPTAPSTADEATNEPSNPETSNPPEVESKEAVDTHTETDSKSESVSNGETVSSDVKPSDLKPSAANSNDKLSSSGSEPGTKELSSLAASQEPESSSPDSDLASIGEEEWKVFLQGPVLANMVDEETLAQHDGLSPMQRLEYTSTGHTTAVRPDWMKDNMWKLCQHLELTLSPFSNLCRSVMNNGLQWRIFKEKPDAFEMMVKPFEPKDWTTEEAAATYQSEIFQWEKLTDFQRLILVKTFRPDLLMSTTKKFIADQLGEDFAKASSFNIREVFEESSARVPLIFLLSPGANPTTQILQFAQDMRGSHLHVDMVSLGRGQGPKAEEFIAKAQILKGRWVFLQNCHLAASWMPNLQAIVDNFSKPQSDVDPQFRLWLSSKPDANFPISILQTGTKLAVDAPQGVKTNLMRAVGSPNYERIYTHHKDNPTMHNLLYGLCLFNAIIHERKKYEALGWNIPYEFNESDLEVAMMQLSMLMDASDSVPWAALRYLTGDITYGGRVTDHWDRRCLHSLLQKFYNPEAFDTGYSYSDDKSYSPIPADVGSLSDVRKYIESNLPAVDSPSLFGMTGDAEITYMESQGAHFLDTILAVQPKIVGTLAGIGISTVKGSDEVVIEMAEYMIRNLPKVVEDEEAIAQDTTLGKKPRASFAELVVDESAVMDTTDPYLRSMYRGVFQSALTTCLRQEIDRFNRLLAVIHNSLSLLRRAIRGEIVMSEDLEDAYEAMLVQRIPKKWKVAAYESCKPLSFWIKDLIQRVEFFGQWADQISKYVDTKLKHHYYPTKTGSVSSTAGGSVLGNAIGAGPTSAAAATANTNIDELMTVNIHQHPRSFWLPGFFFPQGFLTALLQNQARAQSVPVDTLQFEFKIAPCSIVDSEDKINDTKLVLPVNKLSFEGPRSEDGVGVLVFGLYLDGARWDLASACLQDSQPGKRFSRLPELQLSPVQVIESDFSTARNTTSSSSSATASRAQSGATGSQSHVTSARYEGPSQTQKSTINKPPDTSASTAPASTSKSMSASVSASVSASLSASVSASATTGNEERTAKYGDAASDSKTFVAGSTDATNENGASKPSVSDTSVEYSSSDLESAAYVSYRCPLYRTSARAGTLSSTGHSTNFVTAIDLPSAHSADFWITRGVALLCQLDDV